MARAALGWGVKTLASRAGIGVNTVARFERGENVTVETMGKIRRALEAAGVTFLADDGAGAGVRVRPGGGG